MMSTCLRFVVLILTSLVIATCSTEPELQRVRRQVAASQQFNPAQPGFYHSTAYLCYGTFYANHCHYNYCFYSTSRSSCCVTQGPLGWYCLCSSNVCPAAAPSSTTTSTTSTTSTTTSTTATTPTTTTPTTTMSTTATTPTTTFSSTTTTKAVNKK